VNGLLSIRGVAKRFGQVKVLNGISLDVAEGEFLTILGESGSGKTTLLRIISGFERPDEGEVWMESERLDVLPPNRRGVNTVFQSYALFPHLSVFENVAYGLRARNTPAKEISARVESALAQVKMSDFTNRRPAQLSGGQQQRVALSRALVNRPKLLLLDEPLSALDANLRRQMQSELKALQREVGIAFLFVTHDQEEANEHSAGALQQATNSVRRLLCWTDEPVTCASGKRGCPCRPPQVALRNARGTDIVLASARAHRFRQPGVSRCANLRANSRLYAETGVQWADRFARN